MDDSKLGSVTIRGFRSIKDSTVDLRDINILIGSNGSGKTNLISALILLQSILEGRLQEYVRRSGLQSLMYGGMRTTGRIEMEFSFGDCVYGFELVPNDEEKLVFRREYHGRDDARSDFDRTPYGYESECGRGVPGLEHGIGPVLEARKWKLYRFHDTTSTARMRQAGWLSDSASLHHDASNLASFLYMLKQSFPNSYDDVVRVVRMVVPNFEDFILEPDTWNEGIVRLGWKQTGMDEIFGADRLSDGTIRFICLATLLLEPPAFQPATIMIEEPESGLHPYAISVFAELVHMASFEKQIIISTQSADLLDYFEADDVIVSESTSDGSIYSHLSADALRGWLDEYALSTIWRRNIIGGRP